MSNPRIAMRTRAIRAAVILALGVAWAPTTNAQMPQIELSGPFVKLFIESYADVKNTAAELSAQYGDQNGDGGPGSGLAAWVAVPAAQGALNGAVQAHGFDSFSTWIQVMTSVAAAYGFAKDGGQMDAGMSEAIAQIENSPNMSAAQKEMMLQQLQGAMGSVSAMKPSQNNIDAVAPHMAELTALFEAN